MEKLYDYRNYREKRENSGGGICSAGRSGHPLSSKITRAIEEARTQVLRDANTNNSSLVESSRVTRRVSGQSKVGGALGAMPMGLTGATGRVLISTSAF